MSTKTIPDAYLAKPTSEMQSNHHDMMKMYIQAMPPGATLPLSVDVELVNTLGDIVGKASISGTVETVILLPGTPGPLVVFSTGERVALYTSEDTGF